MDGCPLKRGCGQFGTKQPKQGSLTGSTGCGWATSAIVKVSGTAYTSSDCTLDRDTACTFGLMEEEIVLLLCGGDKSSQATDIRTAQLYWQEFRDHENEEL